MAQKTGFWSRVGRWGPFRVISESIRSKVLVSLLALALIPLVTLGVIVYWTASNTLSSEAFGELSAIEELKRDGIVRLMKVWANDVQDVSTDPDVIEGMVNLRDGFRTLGAAQARQLYLGQPELPDAGDGSAYSAEHARQHGDFFPFYLAYHGYPDAFMVDLSGNVVYSRRKSAVFGTNLETGEFSDTNLAQLYQALKDAEEVDRVYLVDAAPFEGEVALFVGSPIYQGDTQAGILIYRPPFEQINSVMQEVTGLGEGGDSYLVGADYLFRSDSRFATQLGVASTILTSRAETPAVQDALAGNTGTAVIQDFRDREVLSSWAPLTAADLRDNDLTGFHHLIDSGINWALVTEVPLAEVQAPVRRLALITGLVILAAILLVVIIAFLLSGNLVRQIRRINELFSRIGIGDLTARVEVRSRDELGTMAHSLNAMLDNTVGLIQSREERDRIQASIQRLLNEVSGVAEGDLTAEVEVTTDITGSIGDSFNFMIAELRRVISNARDTTLQVSSAANEIQTTAEHLAQGSEAQSQQILDTSAAVDEMAMSIQQVSENSTQAAEVADHARRSARHGSESVTKTIAGMNAIRSQVQETSKRIKRLGESSQEIGEIVQLIGDIADRTSILALNASIQAAMAGEAGRGFAVVAEEVERLAERSAEATKRISTLIKSVQSETTEAVAAMEATTKEVVGGSTVANEAGQALSEIASVSDRLAELIQSISLAAKQQARGSESVAKSMGEISEVTQQTSAGTKQAAVSIRNLAELADDLRESIGRFKLPGGAPGRAA